MSRRRRVREYRSFTEDFVIGPQHVSPRTVSDYQNSPVLRWLAGVLAWGYCHWWRRVKVVGQTPADLRRYGGYVLYGNHTQPTGDALIPVWLTGARRLPFGAGFSTRNSEMKRV